MIDLQSDEIAELKEILENFYDCIENRNDEKLLEIVHPEAKMFTVRKDDSLTIMTPNEFINSEILEYHPVDINFEIKEIKHIDMQDPIASAEVGWLVHKSKSLGIHCTYFHFVKFKEKWLIVNCTDLGKEIWKNQ